MATNIIVAKFCADQTRAWTDELWQYDYGQILKFDGLELPDAYEVHFSNQPLTGETITQIGNADGVTIPDQFLQISAMSMGIPQITSRETTYVADGENGRVIHHVKDLTAYEEQSDSVTLIQYQAGAMGLNLQKANKVIYFTLTDKSELFEQSKKRIHRIGQNLPCFYYLLICKNSVEELVLKTLEQRRDFTDELFKESEV